MPAGFSLSSLVGISPVDHWSTSYRCSAPNRSAVLCAFRCWNDGRKGLSFWKRLQKGVRLCVSTSIATTLMEI
jgi:hypothetical protein